jgi:hypothetical protein
MVQKSPTSVADLALNILSRVTRTIGQCVDEHLKEKNHNKTPDSPNDSSGYGKQSTNHEVSVTDTVSVRELNQLGTAINTYVANTEQQNRQEHRDKWRLGLEIAGFVLVFVGAVLAGINIHILSKNLKASQDAAQGAMSAAKTADGTLQQTRDAFRIEERPYVIADGRPAFLDKVESLNPSVNFAIKDIGKTPAKSALTKFRLLLYRYDSLSATRESATREILSQRFIAFTQKQFDEMSAETRKYSSLINMDIAPNQISPFQTLMLTTPLSADDPSKIATLNEFLVFVGFVSYRDSFDVSYQTDFCDIFVGTNPNIWSYCSTHNTIR